VIASVRQVQDSRAVHQQGSWVVLVGGPWGTVSADQQVTVNGSQQVIVSAAHWPCLVVQVQGTLIALRVSWVAVRVLEVWVRLAG
jgi:hypothetical protein